MKPIVEFEVVDHGIEHCQYFQGWGTSFTKYTCCATGIGNNFAEAIDDCLEMLAQDEWDTEGMESRILAEDLPGANELPVLPCITEGEAECGEIFYHVSIRVK